MTDPLSTGSVRNCIQFLERLEQPLTSIPKIGPKTAQQFSKLNLYTVRSLLWHFPASFIDRSSLVTDLSSLPLSTTNAIVVTLGVTVEKFNRTPICFKAHCRDSSGNKLVLTYFHGRDKRSAQRVSMGAQQKLGEMNSRRIISGKVKRIPSSSGGGGRDVEGRLSASYTYEIIQPDLVERMENAETILRQEPVYRLTESLTQKRMRETIRQALDQAQGMMENLPDMIPLALREELNWPTFRDALLLAHYPDSVQNARSGVSSPARMCIAFHELCAQQAHLSLTKWRYKHPHSVSRINESYVLTANYVSWRESPLVSTAISGLPFDLTDGQMSCLDEMWKDALGFQKSGPRKMARLLRGDVGSGKTVIAYLLGLGLMEAKSKKDVSSLDSASVVVILAPTTVLVTQHVNTLRMFIERLNEKRKYFGNGMHPKKISVVELTGNVIGNARENLLTDIESASGEEAFFIVGTHALLTQDVADRLSHLRSDKSVNSTIKMPQRSGISLAVIDEEQRFGVEQRDVLSSYADHSLYMSATPIPRTLALASSFMGSLDISILDSKPSSARQVKTSIIDSKKVEEVIQGVVRQTALGAKVFWILPVIGEINQEEDVHQMNVYKRYNVLSNVMGSDRVELLHGRMSNKERSDVLEKISSPSSPVDVIVGTTVLEVGIDVPSVTILVVEDSHRFGLSQLHQLRGRIGRATSSSESIDKELECHCLLLTNDIGEMNGKEKAMYRLSVLKRSNDGGEVAEADFALRGPGELLGLRQSGLKNGFTVEILHHLGLLSTASQVGRSFLDNSDEKTQYNLDGRVILDERLGGYSESTVIQKFINETNGHFPSIFTQSSTMSDLVLRVLICFFGSWDQQHNEDNAGLTLTTLTKFDDSRGLIGLNVNSEFLNLANKLGVVEHDDVNIDSDEVINNAEKIKERLTVNRDDVAKAAKVQFQFILSHR